MLIRTICTMAVLCGITFAAPAQADTIMNAEPFEVLKPTADYKYNRRVGNLTAEPVSSTKKAQNAFEQAGQQIDRSFASAIAYLDESLDNLRESGSSYSRDAERQLKKTGRGLQRSWRKAVRQFNRAQRKAIREIERTERNIERTSGITANDISIEFQRIGEVVSDTVDRALDDVNRFIGSLSD